MPKRTDDFPTECNAADLSRLLGVSLAQVYALVRRGVLDKLGTGKYDIAACFQSYLRFKTVGQTGDDIVNREQVRADTEAERLRLIRSQADFQAKKVEVLNGQYIPRAEVEAALAPIFSDFTDFLRANFEREFPAWAVGKSAPEIKAECQARIDDSITRVRNGSSAALDTAEQKATGMVGADDKGDHPEILKPGRKKEPGSRRSERAKRHATQGRPSAGRKPKKKAK